MLVGTLMLLGTNQFFDCNPHCTCMIFCIHSVAIIIHVVSNFQADWSSWQGGTCWLHWRSCYICTSHFSLMRSCLIKMSFSYIFCIIRSQCFFSSLNGDNLRKTDRKNDEILWAWHAVCWLMAEAWGTPLCQTHSFLIWQSGNASVTLSQGAPNVIFYNLWLYIFLYTFHTTPYFNFSLIGT